MAACFHEVHLTPQDSSEPLPTPTMTYCPHCSTQQTETYSFLQTNLLSADISLAPITCVMNEHSLERYRPGTHQRNVVFVLVLTLSNRIAGLAVRSTHESFGSSSQEASPAESQPWREDEDMNGSTNWVWVLLSFITTEKLILIHVQLRLKVSIWYKAAHRTTEF